MKITLGFAQHFKIKLTLITSVTGQTFKCMKDPCGHIISFINFCRLSHKKKKVIFKNIFFQFYLVFDCNEILKSKINK